MPDESALLGELAEEYTTRVRAGQLPDVEDYARRHPDLAERIRELFPALMFLEGMAGTPAADLPPFAAELTAGQTFGHYRIEREVGRGGMGIVYQAVHVALERRVALKVLPVRGPRPAVQLERFLREARTAAGLHHTNIVPVLDVGQVAGIPYYAMPFIEGRGLDQVLRELEEGGAAGAPADGDFFRWAAGLGVQAAEGLAHAHQRGVIHRDVKPSNLLLDEQGVLWITDFGLARRLEDPTLTGSGVVLGTPRYMSPEQAEAWKRPVDARTDLYSLGATLYELLTRRPAFDGRTPQEVVAQILEREPPAPRRLNPAVPRDLETIVLTAMARRPEDRYATAQDLADDLRRFREGRRIKARRLRMAQRTVNWARRHPAAAALAACLVVVVILGVMGTSWLWVRAREQRQRALLAEQAAREQHRKAQQAARAALDEADRQRRTAEANFRRARQAVDEAMTRLAEKPPALDDRNQREELLRQALAYYAKVAASDSKEPPVRREAGNAYRRIGAIWRKLGEPGKARDAYRKAVAIQQKLAADFPNVAAYQEDLRITRKALADLTQGGGD